MVDQKAQFRLFIPFFILFMINILMALLTQHQILSVASDDVLLNQSIAMIVKFNQLASSTLTISLFGVFLTGTLSLSLWLFYSHRLFGPVVPIQRHVEDLKNGNYDGQIRLRKFDEMKPLAESINSLTEILKSNSSQLKG